MLGYLANINVNKREERRIVTNEKQFRAEFGRTLSI